MIKIQRKEDCCGCHACAQVCPKQCIAMTYDEEERMRSSSGGMFILLAQQVIERGGVVFGVVYDKEWQLHHVAALTMEDVYPMMGSTSRSYTALLSSLLSSGCSMCRNGVFSCDA